MDKAHHGAAIALFSVQLFFFRFFSYAGGVLEINLFTVIVMICFGFAVTQPARDVTGTSPEGLLMVLTFGTSRRPLGDS